MKTNKLNAITNYDSKQLHIMPFNKKDDVVEGIVMSVGNMVSGYQFTLGGKEFLTSEAAYICGAYSKQGQEAWQEEIRTFTGGGLCLKMRYRNRKEARQFVREDWNDSWNIMFMLLVVWAKCKGNKDFAALLCSIPADAVIVENGTGKKRGDVWGAYLNAEAGVWTGRNIMGKILMTCRDCLLNDSYPDIDWDLLKQKEIWWFGELLDLDACRHELCPDYLQRLNCVQELRAAA